MGVVASLNVNPSKPAIPIVKLVNFSSLSNNLDDIRLWRLLQHGVRDCFVYIFSERLMDKTTDSEIELVGLTRYRADRVTPTSTSGAKEAWLFTQTIHGALMLE